MFAVYFPKGLATKNT